MNRRSMLGMIAGAVAAVVAGPLVTREPRIRRWVISYSGLTGEQCRVLDQHWRGASLFAKNDVGEWVQDWVSSKKR